MRRQGRERGNGGGRRAPSKNGRHAATRPSFVLKNHLTPSSPPLVRQEPDYVHAKHMYDITSIKGRKWKFGVGTFAVAGGGAAVTAIAVNHAQSKVKG